ncbi:MAG TPA: hypothetical protein VJ901_10045 [Thermoanaerobaculia bacterium]|nr:hypothetical protein [Thermoanaerobaculia bacterium]
METLFQQFERPMTDGAGDSFFVFVQGRSRPHDTWEAWLVFERQRDSRRFSTPVETTQPDANAILYWASGLTGTYLQGALERALSVSIAPRSMAEAPPLVGYGVDAVEHSRRLTLIERHILALFQNIRLTRLLTARVLDQLPYAHADIVRAIEDLEKRKLVVRRTENGNDWVCLSQEGVRVTGLTDTRRHDDRLSSL